MQQAPNKKVQIINDAINLLENVGWCQCADRVVDKEGKVIAHCMRDAIAVAIDRNWRDIGILSKILLYKELDRYIWKQGIANSAIEFNDSIASKKWEVINLLERFKEDELQKEEL